MSALLPTIRDDFESRDPDYIRQFLPILWLLASFWYRAEVRGLEKIPPDGPVLLVGNHSGGNMTPDTGAFVLAFSAYFGAERPFYQLAHSLVLDDAGPLVAAQVRDRCRVAGERRQGAPQRGGPARLPGWGLRGAPAHLGIGQG